MSAYCVSHIDHPETHRVQFEFHERRGSDIYTSGPIFVSAHLCGAPLWSYLSVVAKKRIDRAEMPASEGSQSVKGR